MNVKPSVAKRNAGESWQTASWLTSFYQLAGANLFPLVGLGFLGWRGESLILLYFLESIVVYLVTAKMLAVVAALRDLQLVAGYLVRYGLGLIFIAVLWFGIFGEFVGRFDDVLAERGLLPSAAILVASHIISYYTDFIGRKEYERLRWQTIEARMLAMYFVMFVVPLIMIGLFFLHSPAIVVAVIVIVKTLIALDAFATERTRSGEDGELSPADYVAPTATCPHCGKPLRTNLAKQCYHCGADWHEINKKSE